jgi:hypothetical protein
MLFMENIQFFTIFIETLNSNGYLSLVLFIVIIKNFKSYQIFQKILQTILNKIFFLIILAGQPFSV